ncbi:3'-5' exonuclease [Gordonia malaquae]|uniref:Putative DNA polymerase III subunit epsilon n=1 Tax=Gordonia phage GRU3 TaxID=1647473 RepID=A0A0K0N5Q6_9CAUD|nr:DNA polymerase exonuclease subunit [Gordonia phage GRU3]AKJ72274.1 putative DNA polymerase III subunit epsilon [Gordonia phage GRU3]
MSYDQTQTPGLDSRGGSGPSSIGTEQGSNTRRRDVQGAEAARSSSSSEQRDRSARLKYVALDLETTGLDPRVDHPLEIAAVEVFPDQPERGYGKVHTFVPWHARSIVNEASPEALSVNRYFERRLYAQKLDVARTDDALRELVAMLDGATLVGANPAFDAAMLWAWLDRNIDLAAPPWHFRLYDVEAATAAALGLPRVPGLSKCAKELGINTDPYPAHTALGDAFLTADVFVAVYNRHRTAPDNVDGGQHA